MTKIQRVHFPAVCCLCSSPFWRLPDFCRGRLWSATLLPCSNLPLGQLLWRESKSSLSPLGLGNKVFGPLDSSFRGVLLLMVRHGLFWNHLATNGAWGFFPLVLLLLVILKAFFGLVEPGAIWAGMVFFLVQVSLVSCFLSRCGASNSFLHFLQAYTMTLPLGVFCLTLCFLALWEVRQS